MLFQPPPIDETKAKELLEQLKTKASEISAGKISDFSDGSVVTVLFESMAFLSSILQGEINDILTNLEKNRLAIFGLERREAASSIGTIIVKLNGVYAEPFLLPQNFSLLINNIEFTTISSLTIRPYTDTAEVSIISSVGGSIGNLPRDSEITYPLVPRVASITLLEDTRGGVDSETNEEWNQRIYSLIESRQTLLAERDFDQAVKDYLGQNSIVKTIGRLKDKDTFENGYVTVFARNEDGSELNTAQLSELQALFNSQIAMATVNISNFEEFEIKIGIFASFTGTVSPDSIHTTILDTVRDYVRNLEPGQPLMNKAIEYFVQQIEGIVLGAVSVTINGFAQPQALPNQFTIAKFTLFESELINADIQGQSFKYSDNL